MKTIKRLALGLLVVVFLAVIGIGILIFTLDANLLKPVLHRVAQEQGVELNIPGDIEWQFYPNLGLNLGVVEVSTLEDQQPLAAIASASVSVKLMPLLRDREILVNGIILDGLDAQFHVDEEGNSAWSQLGKKDDATEPPTAPPDAEQSLPTLAIEILKVTNLSLTYTDAQTGDKVRVYDTDLSSQNFSLTGDPFALALSTAIDYNQQPTARIDWRGPVALDLEAKTASTDSGELQVQLGEANAKLDITNKTHWGEPFTSNGALTLHPTALTPLFNALDITVPPVSSPDVLQQFGAQFEYAVTDEQAAISDAVLQLDQTRLKGELSVTDFEQPKIQTRWQGNTLPLDDYLPPATEEQEEPEPAAPQPLPIEALQALNLEATVGFDEILVEGLVLKQPQVEISASDGLIRLKQLAMRVADGTVTGQGQLDARQPQVALSLQLDSDNVDLGELLNTVADIENIRGNVSANVVLTSVGVTDQALVDNLKANITAQSQELTLSPFNLEEQFCKALALVQQEAPKPFDWPAMTELEPVSLQLTLSEKTLKLDQLSAEIANLLGAAQGQFNLATGEFNIPFNLSVGDFAANIPGCLPIKEKWRERALPLRCKGSIKDIGVGTCLPDTKLLTQMAKEKIKGEVQEKITEKKDELEQKVGEKAREALGKELGKEKTEELEGTVKGVLDRLKGKQ